MARPKKTRLGEVLLEQGLLTQAQLEHALEEQKASGRKLGRILLDTGALTEPQLAQALATQLDLPFVDLRQVNLDAAAMQKLPELMARRFRAIILEDRPHSYLLGMVDPTDLFAYDEIGRVLQRRIELAVVVESTLLQLIDNTHRRTGEITTLAQELGDDMGDSVVDFANLPTQRIDEAPVVKLLQTLFEDAVQVRASDIHIEPQEAKLLIRFRIDGVMHLQTEADLKITTALVLRLKLTAGLDISEKRLPQDGRFQVRVRHQQVDVRMSTMPTQYGESVVMRLLIQHASGFSLERLGMPPALLARFRSLLHRPNGMVLVTGPTGSGKTTTLYAALSELNSTANKIITVEDPVEYRLPGINQVQVNEKIDLDFARVLRSVLRQDPDIILVGEMRDQETAQIGLRAAMTGHMVLSTLHTNDAISTPIRLIDMGAPRYMVAMSLLAVVAQRLLRMVCERCGQPHAPTPAELAWLRLELGDAAESSALVQGRGCTQCNHTGYQGRVGVYELLEMNAELTEAANQADTALFVNQARKQMAGHTLRRAAVELVLAKRTTVAEAMRISNQLEE
ncbi:GspE/PulE family protein [Pseudomethylobacillus aquaticus]|uniref:GspE/PulE family protein n=1 Tax=Pseudomethylobacillus aquaticus TaxID=2676064 RepID=A0A3N0V3S2_9PROT|nr:GspE/PulE family protein [Pseudomethylobacillus aquaticus]ROH87345.1 GspE/PulE family protein [Pseudomethylobacillus aquaticus]